MSPRHPLDFPHPCFAPFRDDAQLTAEESLIAYWIAHDLYFARCLDDLAQRKVKGYVVPVPPDDLVASLAEIMSPLPGREAEYVDWVGVTFGRGVTAWVEARKRGDQSSR